MRRPTTAEYEHERMRVQNFLAKYHHDDERLRTNILKRAKAIRTEQKLYNFLYTLKQFVRTQPYVNSVQAIFDERFNEITDFGYTRVCPTCHQTFSSTTEMYVVECDKCKMVTKLGQKLSKIQASQKLRTKVTGRRLALDEDI